MTEQGKKEYRGYMFAGHFDRGRAAGVLTIEDGFLRFQTATRSASQSDIQGQTPGFSSGVAGGYSYSMPLDDIVVTTGGAGGRVIYFSSPHDNKISFCSSDRKILKNKALCGSPQAAKIASHRRLIRNIEMGILLLLLLLGVGLGWILVGSYNPAIKYVADKIPFAWEQALGDVVFKQVLMGKVVIEDQQLKEQLALVTDRLTEAVAASKEVGYKFEFYIVRDDVVNAFALPGGKVVVNSGLIQKSENANELAGVLAHEIAHVTCRHHLQSMIKNLGLMMAIKVIFGDVGDMAGMGSQLVLLKTSREFEYQADSKAVGYLKAAEIDPSGMVSFFEKLKAQEGPTAEVYQSMDLLSTHPATQDRINELERVIGSKQEQYQEIAVEYEAFKAKVGQ